MAFVTVNNCQLYYKLQGQGDPLVLISGLSTDHHSWDTVVEELSKHYQVLVFDNRGCGQSDTPDIPYSIDLFADDTMALCQALSLDNLHVVGNSMGGNIVQSLGRRYAQQLRSLTMVNTTMLRHTPSYIAIEQKRQLWRQGLDAENLNQLMIPWAFSNTYLQKPGMAKQLAELFLQNPHPQSLLGFERQLDALKQFESQSWISEIELPTLVITGNEDIIFPPAYSVEIAKAMPNTHYICFEKTGHLTHIERPNEFCQALLSFLTEVNTINEQTSHVND